MKQYVQAKELESTRRTILVTPATPVSDLTTLSADFASGRKTRTKTPEQHPQQTKDLRRSLSTIITRAISDSSHEEKKAEDVHTYTQSNMNSQLFGNS